jgi:hypothetical protein
MAFPVRRRFVVDPEDAGFVAVERHRLAVSMKILPRGFEVPERRLGTAEEHNH